MVEFSTPFALLLFLLIPAMEWIRRTGAVRQNIAYRSSEFPPTWRLQSRKLLIFLRIVAVTLLGFAMASPFDWRHIDAIDVEGIGIELVIDRSGSMRADDYRLHESRVARLRAVTDVARDFVVGRPVPGARRSDAIGLITFAAQAEIVLSPTLDHEAVAAELDRTTAARDFREDGTAIGDALGAAIAELCEWEAGIRKASTADEPDERLSKVVILLTDGQQNAGELSPEDAFQLAMHFGVRVYVIGLEPNSIEVESARKRIATEQKRLRRLSKSTGGKAYSVSDTETLRAVYQKIEELETSQMPSPGWFVRRHWAVSWFEIGYFGFPPILVVSLALLALESGLRWTLLMEYP